MKTSVFVGMALIVGAMTVACSSSSDSSGMPSTPTGSSGSSGSMGSSGSTDQGSLYDRLGKHDGIAKAVDAIVAEELKDPEVASYFYFQVQTPIPAGHPSADQIKECLVAQLGNAAGGMEQYPTTVSGGFQCRGMTAAHAQLGIPNGVFTKFLTIAAGVLKSAGVADADVATVGSVLEGTRAQVAQDTSRDGGSFVPPSN